MATHPVLTARALYVVERRPLFNVVSLADYWSMTKPEVNLLIVVTTVAAFCQAWRPALADLPWLLLVHTVIGTALVASGAAVLNQWMERAFDARMRRTSRRPIAAGRIAPARARAFGTWLSLIGTVYLAYSAGILAAALATLTLLIYLFLYTPLKRATPFCTLVGAVPGAMPPLIGWAAARGHLDPDAWVLFWIVFLWQFPHFIAIAWMYREDYDRAGYRVLPHGRERSLFARVQTLLPLPALIGISLAPVWSVGIKGADVLYALSALLLGIVFSCFAVRFAQHLSGATARRLLCASILYLFVLFGLIILSHVQA